MPNFLPHLLTAAPLFAFACSYFYSWMFFGRVLGEYAYLISLQDYVVRGASVLPLVFSSMAVTFILTAVDFNSVRKNPDQPLSYTKYIPNKFTFVIITMFCVVLIFESAFDLFYKGVLFPAALCVFIALWGTWSRNAQRNYSHSVWVQYVFLCAAAIFLLAGARGVDDAGVALRRRQASPNVFQVGNNTLSADLIAAVSGNYLLRTPNGDFYLRAPENKESIFLFNRPAQPPPRFDRLFGLVAHALVETLRTK